MDGPSSAVASWSKQLYPPKKILPENSMIFKNQNGPVIFG